MNNNTTTVATPTTRGIHHITAIASGPQQNHDFYTRVLGLRLVKKTVNFDDPGTYHFYFGDSVGSPGTILTFFPWPGAHGGKPGAGQATATAFAVPIGSIDAFWAARFASMGVAGVGRSIRFGQTVLAFEDHDGLPMELMESTDVSPTGAWATDDVPLAHAIRAFHSTTLTVRRLEGTEAVLVQKLGLTKLGEEGNRHRYTGDAGHGAIVDVIVDPAAERGRSGAGTVHHVAFRADDDEAQRAWQTVLAEDGFNVSPVMDRNYFHSIYFREPSGVLFEIATDAPGFAIDEPIDSLGQTLKLPAPYESHRAAIEAHLPKLA
jgi:glyoxalase family protein